jgi:hypothetical protein
MLNGVAPLKHLNLFNGAEQSALPVQQFFPHLNHQIVVKIYKFIQIFKT